MVSILEKQYYRTNTTVTTEVINDNGDTQDKVVRGDALFADGLYFVERVDGFTLKFAKSRDDILNGKYVSVDSSVTVTDNTIQPYESDSKTSQTSETSEKNFYTNSSRF